MHMSKKVLLIDDDLPSLTLLEFKLKNAGYEIELAHDGQEGKDKLNAFTPDMVITDLMMPKLTGLDLIKIIRLDLKLDIPIIMLTSAGQEQIVMQAFELGSNDYITKPYDTEELIRRTALLIENFQEIYA